MVSLLRRINHSEIGAGDQPQDRQGAWPRSATDTACHRRRADRVKLPRRNFSASGRRCCRAVGRVARRSSASLSGAAGTLGRRVYSRRRERHYRSSDGSMANGAAWSAVHHREPAGCGHEYRRRGGRECGS